MSVSKSFIITNKYKYIISPVCIIFCFYINKTSSSQASSQTSPQAS